MYACICSAVTVEEVNLAIDAGADSVDSVGEQTYAGTCCGTCHPTLESMIETRCGACPKSLAAALSVA